MALESLPLLNVMKALIFLLLLASGMTYAAVPVITCTPARTSGVAPLHVFLDCTATTDDGTSVPFIDLHYEHSFGDATAGTWTYGAKAGHSKNFAIGAVAAHIYETAGSYTITSRACDATGCAQTTNAITVTDADTDFTGTATICIAQLTLPVAGSGGCPSGAAVSTNADFDNAVNSNIATHKRVLFKRGDTFTGSVTANISIDGPGLIGAYGSGAKPQINGSGDTTILSFGTYNQAVHSDWRVTDLVLDGADGQAGENVGIGTYGPFHQVTILRVDTDNVATGFASSHWTLTTGQPIYQQWAIHDSTARGVYHCNWQDHYVCGWRFFGDGYNLSMQGNDFDNEAELSAPFYSSGSHTFRAEMLRYSVVSNNRFAGNGAFQAAIKQHGWTWAGGANMPANTYSEYFIFADNRIQAGAGYEIVHFTPQDSGEDERLRQYIFERNWVKASSRSQGMVYGGGSYFAFRNNVIDITDMMWYTQVFNVRQEGVEPAPTNVRVENNTVYSSSGEANSPDVYHIVVLNEADVVSVQNNLVYAPYAVSSIAVVNNVSSTNVTGASGTHGNSSNAQVTSTCPFVDCTPTALADYRPVTSAYPTTNGTNLYPTTKSDMYNCTDKTSTNYRSGALVPKANARCKGGK